MLNHEVSVEYTRNAYDFVMEMEKHSHLKLQRKTNPVYNLKFNRERFSELFPLLFASFASIFLLFYARFGLVDGVEGQSCCYNESRGSSSNCNHKMCYYSYAPRENGSKDYKNSACSKFNASVVCNNSSIHGNDPKDMEVSHRVFSGREDLISVMLGSFHLYCRVPPLALQENKAEPQSDKRSNLTYPDLEEFRTMSRQDTDWNSPGRLVNITHRLEPDGIPYNYASASKGAKVVAENRETKGASNVLVEDHDKYLRNPCSVEGKFFVIELVDETLVDHVKIANFEHYSSNLKEFEIYGSLSYPTELWTSLGTYTAANVKQAQCFKLSEPKWVRYLKFNLMSHYGSDFYCTLSLVEVYGVDAIEQMLEDLIVTSGESTKNGTPSPNSTMPPLESSAELGSGNRQADEAIQNFTVSIGKVIDTTDELLSFDSSKKSDAQTSNLDPMPKARQKSNGRVHADAVLKILLQKVRSLELNLSVLEEYIKAINKRRQDILPVLEKEIQKIAHVLENSKADIQNLLEWKQKMEEGLDDLESWKATALAQMDFLARENHLLRLDMGQIMINQTILERKELVAFTVSISVACFVVLRFVISKVSAVVRFCIPSTTFRTSKGWFLMLISSCITTLLVFITV